MRFKLLILFLFYSAMIFAQDSAIIKLQEWQENYLFASKTYDDLVSNPELFENDSVLNSELIIALDKIVLSLKNCREAIALNPYYVADAKFMMVESCVLGLWYCQIESTQQVFNDSLSVAFLNVCKDFKPNVYSIDYYDLHFRELLIDEFYQSYYNQVFLEFLVSSKHEISNASLKSGELYLSDLLIMFDRDFPAVIFYDSEYHFEQGRVFKILEEIIPLTDTISKKLELKLLQLEYMANFYYYQNLEDSTFSLNESEKEIITSCESLIAENTDEFQRVPESSYRLADVYFLLKDFKQGVKYYSRAVVKKTSSTEDLKKFISLTMSIADTTNDLEFKENCKILLDNAADIIVEKESPIEELATLQYLVKTYQFSGNGEMEVKIETKIKKVQEEIAEKERKAEKREKYGFRIGIAPLKLLYINRYHQISFTGDIKINGFEQGFRYCNFNGYQDAFRFGAWIYPGIDELNENTYDGDEFSYWVTLTNIEDGDFEHKFCVEARYGNYRFETVTANIVNKDLDYIQFYDYEVNAIAHRYDISAVYRLSLFSAGFFYIESSLSMGLGFRYLASEFNRESFIIDDARYSDSLWPMITAPIRAGLRVGIRFF